MGKVYAYYLVREDKKGIVNSWPECESIVKGSSARYKGFASKKDAKAWLEEGALYSKDSSNGKKKPNAAEKAVMRSKLEKGIYFDAGTGRGFGAESRVTDERGIDLLPLVLDRSKLTEFDTYRLKEGDTHNLGELLGLYFALQVAKKKNIKKIFGDSKLIIDYWSMGKINKKNLSDETINYSDLVTKMRKEFDLDGGTVEHVSGDVNPADLGFHK